MIARLVLTFCASVTFALLATVVVEAHRDGMARLRRAQARATAGPVRSVSPEPDPSDPPIYRATLADLGIRP